MTHRLPRVAAAAALVVLAPTLSAIAFLGSDTPDRTASAVEPMTLNTTYDCTNSFDRKVSELPVNADVTVTRTSADRVALAVSTGKLDFDLGGETPDVRLSSRMDLLVNGSPATVNGSATVTLNAANPPDFPVATGSAAATGDSVTVTPGKLVVDITVSGFTVNLDCAVKGPAPTVTVRLAGMPVQPPQPAQPAAKVRPGLTAKLTKKTQRVGRAPARAVVQVRRTAGAGRPVGTVTVKVGKRTVATRKVKGATRFRVALPKKLKPGRHKVAVKFTPVKDSGYRTRTARVTLRVKR